jgi:hypothetical protein
VKLLADKGDFTAMEKLANDSMKNGKLNLPVGMRKALSNMSATVQKINQNTEMTSDEKRESIDKIYYMMIETAKQGNEILDASNEILGD